MISSGFLYLGFSQVPLVDDEDAGSVSASDEVGDFLVLLEDSIDSVKDKNGDVAAVDSVAGASDTEVLEAVLDAALLDRKSTRLNSSHW